MSYKTRSKLGSGTIYDHDKFGLSSMLELGLNLTDTSPSFLGLLVGYGRDGAVF